MGSQQKLSNALLLFVCLFWFLVVAVCVWSREGTQWMATDYNSVSASVEKEGSLFWLNEFQIYDLVILLRCP